MNTTNTPSSPDAASELDLSEIAEASSWDRVASSYAESLAEHLGLYSADALRLAEVSAGDDVLDVATGPGTLALQAARLTRVHALDFSAQMLAQLRRRASEQELENLVLQQGDGQALPYAASSFDAAFSMFGLFMFPDRARGFAELARVLRPGGRAVVASWQPQNEIPAFAAINAEIVEESATLGSGGPPLADRAEFDAEMSAAGFAVEIHGVTYTLRFPSIEALWQEMERAHVVLGIASDQFPPARYAALRERIHRRMVSELGTGPQEVTMPAWLALGRLGGEDPGNG